MGCEYCEGKIKYRSSNFCGAAKLEILGRYMDITGDKEKFSLFKRTYKPSFRIYYCPICGKKLEE